MTTDISEKNLESILVGYLRDVHGYEEGVSEDYNKDYALDTERVKRFILASNWLHEVLPMYCVKDFAIYRSCSICIIPCRRN